METILLSLFLFIGVSFGQFLGFPAVFPTFNQGTPQVSQSALNRFFAANMDQQLNKRISDSFFPDGVPDTLNKGCSLRVIEWARLESNLPTINYNVNGFTKFPVRIGKCNKDHKDMQWAKLVTNIGERILNVNENHIVTFNGYFCYNTRSWHGVKIETKVNPTCPNQKQLVDGVQDGCGLKKVQWAKVESDLGSITLQVNKDHVIGRCSPQYPTMQWARLVTNAGVKDLDMKVDNEIKFNNKNCAGEGFGAEVIIHRDCNPDKFRSENYEKIKKIEYSL